MDSQRRCADTRFAMMIGCTCPALLPAGTGGRHAAAGGVLRIACLRYAALCLIVLALGAGIDLREIAPALQDVTRDQSALAAAILHCGPKSPATPHMPASPGHAAVTLAAALSLPAPLVIEPPTLARRPASQPASQATHPFAQSSPPPTLPIPRSRAPPRRV